MSRVLSRFFSQYELDRVSQAIHDAEVHTAGEVVPFVVERSDDYEEAELRAAIVFGLVPLITVDVIRMFTDFWVPLNTVELTILVLVCMGLGWVSGKFVAPLKRLFAGGSLMDRRVAQRAAEAFIAEEVFKTRDRTGILIFISLLEHEVLVMGDTGIHARVKAEDWRTIVNKIIAGIRSGKLAEAIIEGLNMCGDLLRRSGLEARPLDTNELPNTLRTGK